MILTSPSITSADKNISQIIHTLHIPTHETHCTSFTLQISRSPETNSFKFSRSSSGPPADCKYRLHTTTASTLDLPDGRTSAWDEYGDPAGEPVINVPGFPSSRIEGAGLGPEASKVGARIISIDRPGYGLSSFHKDRTLLSHAQDVEALARHLRLQRYGVFGISGGGPYALACARALPADKMRAVCIVCGLGSPDMGYWGMNWMSWAGWTFGQRYLPGLCRWWSRSEPGARLDLSEEERMKLMRKDFEKNEAKIHPKDLPMFGSKDWQWMHIRRSGEVIQARVEYIRKDLPIQVWHGRLDDMVPLQHAQKVAARLGDNACLRITDDTHSSIWALRKDEFLAELVKAIKA